MTIVNDTTRRPSPTTDLDQVRRDLDECGYGLLRDALSPEQIKRVTERLTEQAECEGAAGLASIGDGTQVNRTWITEAAPDVTYQLVRMLLNKGAIFHEVVSQPDVLDLMKGLLGPGFILFSTTGLIMRGGSKPQALHSDQQFVPFPTPMPVIANVMHMITDFDGARGGTRVVPGSHKLPSPAIEPEFDADGKLVGLKEAEAEWIAAEGPAGTALVFDGRLWHAGGANVSGELRLALSTAYCMPFVMQQDLLPMGLTDEVLGSLTPELQQLYGLEWRSGMARIEAATGRSNSNMTWPLIPEMHK